MLKKIYFEGEIMVDDNDSTHNYEYAEYIREHVGEFGIDGLDISLVPIKALKDIPKEWQNSIPFGRKDDSTCKEIFEQEIFPKLGEDDPNQHKFGFFDEVKKAVK